MPHGSGAVSLVVSAIDLFRGQAQSRHHRLRGLEHLGSQLRPVSVCVVGEDGEETESQSGQLSAENFFSYRLQE